MPRTCIPYLPYRTCRTEALLHDAAEQQRTWQAQLVVAQRRLELQATDLAGLASRLVAAEGERTYLERQLARLLPPGKLQEAAGLEAEAGRQSRRSDASERGRVWLGGEVTPRGGGREWEEGEGEGEGMRLVGGETELRERLGQLGRELRAARGEAAAARASAEAAGRAEVAAKSAEAEWKAQVGLASRRACVVRTAGGLDCKCCWAASALPCEVHAALHAGRRASLRCAVVVKGLRQQ